MDKFDRIYKLHRILAGRRTAVSLEDLKTRLECSKATVFRTIEVLKDHFHAPIEHDADQGGYRYIQDPRAPAFELPGLWFSPAELHALIVVQRLLKDAGGGLLDEDFGPLTQRIEELMQHKRLNLSAAATRLRFPAIAGRSPGTAFATAVSATLQRKQVHMRYHARGTDELTERTVSPQRVIHYRESWYLDAWDEGKRALRSFAVDRIRELAVLQTTARDIPEAELEQHYASAYGIFGGLADKVAVLRFSPERARWVADEHWHPEQVGIRLADGSYELRIPYGDARELVMDVLRHGPHVCVVEPPSLREELKRQLAEALAQY